MLTHIHINNFAIIDSLDLELDSGLSVFTGETGAGKSIIVDAIALALGGRADNNIIRPGADRCSISLSFDIHQHQAAKDWLTTHDFSTDDCIISRVIKTDGRSRSTINGQPCTQLMTRELAQQLLTIHGQHAHQLLLKPEYHRLLLDGYAKHHALVQSVKQNYTDWKQVNEEIKSLSNSDDQQARRELLRYQVNELAELSLTEGEVESLEAEHKQLANADELIQQCQSSLNFTVDLEEHSALTQLNHALQSIQRLQDLSLDSIRELLNNAIIQTEEAGQSLRHYLETVEINPERLTHIEQRLTILHDLARKHQVNAKELHHHQKTLQQQLDLLDNSEQRLQQLHQKKIKLESAYLNCAQQLTDSRKKAAKKLNQLISKQIQQLGLPNGQVDIQLQAVEITTPTPFGLEKIIFCVTTNPGQPLMPLAKVASGGELSRISLAIEVICAQQNLAGTLIFDEVDVGIGGKVAEIVGQLLKQLGKSNQVLCITHLAQVAAQGNHHFQVSKQVNKQQTHTSITTLMTKEKIDEIARMIGGIKITDTTRKHAKELLIQEQE